MYLDMCTYKVDFVIFYQQKVWVVCLEYDDLKKTKKQKNQKKQAYTTVIC